MTSPSQPPAAVAALRIDIDGTVTDVTLPADTDGMTRLRALNQLIGCDTVDVVALTPRLDMWLDDNGIYTQIPNLAATVVARGFGLTWQPYWGTVVLTGGADEHGAMLPLGPAARQAVLDLVATLPAVMTILARQDRR